MNNQFPNVSVDVRHEEPDANYFIDDGYEQSTKIKDWLRCPSLYEAKYVTGKTPKTTTQSLERGSLAHLSLQIKRPETERRLRTTPEEYCTQSGVSKSKKAKEFFADQDPDIIWVTPQDAHFLGCMWQGIEDNDAVGALYEEVEHSEVSIRWERPCGFRLKCRPDAITKTGLCIDYKTCRHVDPLREFMRSVKDYSYHVSCALYQEGCAAAGFLNQPQIFVVISTVPPFAVQAIRLPKEVIVKGRRLLEKAISELHAHRAMRLSYTPRGYGEIHTLDYPKWF